MENDHVEPWSRLPGERRNWYARFNRYRLLGPGRSVRQAWYEEQEERITEGDVRRQKRPSRAWYTHSSRDLWESRAEQWDSAETARIESEWRERRRELRESEYSMAESLLQRGKEILAELTDPASWSLSDAIRAIDLGSKIGRLASELMTESVEVKHHRIPEAQLTEDERIARAHEILRIAEQRRNLGGDNEHESDQA